MLDRNDFKLIKSTQQCGDAKYYELWVSDEMLRIWYKIQHHCISAIFLFTGINKEISQNYINLIFFATSAKLVLSTTLFYLTHGLYYHWTFYKYLLLVSWWKDIIKNR